MMNTVFKKALLPAAFAMTLASGTASAVVLNDFIIDEGSVPGNAAGTVTGDKLNGGYSEKITFGLGTFVTHAYGDMGQIFGSDGTALVPSQLNSTYGMYVLFDAAGTFGPSGPGIGFSAGSGSFEIWLDPDQNTTKTLGATGADAIVLGGTTSDDYKLGGGLLTSGTGFLISGIGGFFDLTLTFDLTDFLTPDGKAYFIDPDPFYVTVNVDGDFDSFVTEGTQTINGDVSAVFIPEPGSLALLGIGLTGLGFAARRRKVS